MQVLDDVAQGCVGLGVGAGLATQLKVVLVQFSDDVAQNCSDVGASFGRRSSRLCWCRCRFWTM